MPKYKKTKQQKIITDLRKKLHNTPSSKMSEEKAEILPPQTNEKTVVLRQYNLSANSTPKITELKTNNPYFVHDLKKTGILTGTIVVAQIILFFLLKNHILVLPIAKY